MDEILTYTQELLDFAHTFSSFKSLMDAVAAAHTKGGVNISQEGLQAISNFFANPGNNIFEGTYITSEDELTALLKECGGLGNFIL